LLEIIEYFPKPVTIIPGHPNVSKYISNHIPSSLVSTNLDVSEVEIVSAVPWKKSTIGTV